MTRRYFEDNETAEDLAKEFGPKSRTNKITPTGVREIALRWMRENAPAADNSAGQAPTRAQREDTRGGKK